MFAREFDKALAAGVNTVVIIDYSIIILIFVVINFIVIDIIIIR